MITALGAAGLLDLFLPKRCLGCGRGIAPEDSAELVCPRCQTLLRRPPPPRCPRCDVPRGTGQMEEAPCLECLPWPKLLVQARSAVILEPPADALVHALKYGGWEILGDLMGQRMAGCVPPDWQGLVVVPVPTTAARRRARGYNQAEVLARVVARELRLEMMEGLRRTGGRTQVALTPRERGLNVSSAFHSIPETASRITGSCVMLVDDVLTTGATARSAALALAEAGAASVRLLTFARALPFSGPFRREDER